MVGAIGVGVMLALPAGGQAQSPTFPQAPGFVSFGPTGPEVPPSSSGTIRIDPDVRSPSTNPPGAPQLPEEPCADKRYPDCKRLRYYFGPIAVTPGMNSQLVGPLPKPDYDGYMIRFRPDLVHTDGSRPRVDDVMLHHATWLGPASLHGKWEIGQMVATGEEKTIFQPPHGYGMPVRGTDPWYTMAMIHSSITSTDVVWMEYDVDYVPRKSAEAAGIRPLLPLWLDVGIETDHALYPVFNAVQGYGGINPKSGLRECAYPRDRCAETDPYGNDQPGNGIGYDYPINEQTAGTLVFAFGHLHPGGISDEVTVVRGERKRQIANLDAVYHDPRGRISPDFSMEVTPENWRVKVKPGDVLRLNAYYDTTRASWYEPMGVVIAYVAPGDESGVDPFSTVRVKKKVRVKSRSGRGEKRTTKVRHVYRNVKAPIPMGSRLTHGSLPENQHYGGANVRPLPEFPTTQSQTVTIANFKYFPGDLSSAPDEGIPEVKQDGQLTFVNADGSAQILHTVTSCAKPCTGEAGVGYPIADDPDAKLDSVEMGTGPAAYGWNAGPTKPSYTIDPQDEGLAPDKTYTYFCRVHPFMRGAFKVVR